MRLNAIATYSVVMSANHGDPAMAAYLRDILREWLSADPERTEAEFARLAGVSRASINNVKNLGKGAGPRVVEGFARALGRAPLDLYAGREAHRRGGEAPATTPERERYPNRAAAARVARELGTPDRAVVSVERDALDFEGDPPVTWWLAQMQLRASLFDRPSSPADDARDAALRDELLSRPSQADRLRAEVERRKHQR